MDDEIYTKVEEAIMGQEIEIEFKNMLTKEQYISLLHHFQITNNMIKRQKNIYFDTPNWHLKRLSAGLRLRQLENKTVCTLKIKSSENVHFEITEEVPIEKVKEMIEGKGFFAPTIEKRLIELNVPTDSLQVVASITTDRAEIQYKGGTLVFDRSYYLNCEDYEVEYESNNEKIGRKVFNDFLNEHQIIKKEADKKIARYMKAFFSKEG